jgi:hypothetical protein
MGPENYKGGEPPKEILSDDKETKNQSEVDKNQTEIEKARSICDEFTPKQKEFIEKIFRDGGLFIKKIKETMDAKAISDVKEINYNDFYVVFGEGDHLKNLKSGKGIFILESLITKAVKLILEKRNKSGKGRPPITKDDNQRGKGAWADPKALKERFAELKNIEVERGGYNPDEDDVLNDVSSDVKHKV